MKRLAPFLAFLAAIILCAAPADASPMRLRIRAHATAADPAAITALGLHAVYALPTTGAGLTGTPLTNTPASHAQACTNCTLDVDGISFYITGSNALTNWDFTGYQVFLDGSITVSCGNCKFKARSDRGFALGASQASGGNPTWSCSDCYVDSTTFDVPAGEGAIKWSGTGNETWTRTYWTESSRDQIAHGGSGDLTVSYNYFGGVCIGTPGIGQGGAHCENIHLLNGRLLMDHSFMDFTHMGGRVTAGLTGFLFFQTFTGSASTTATIDTSVSAGASIPSTVPNCHALDVAFTSDTTRQCADFSGGLQYGFQSENGLGGTSVGPVTITITNSALSRGSLGYLLTTIDSGSTITTHYSGNYNFDTGTSLGSTLP